jgi:hypothetical protein
MGWVPRCEGALSPNSAFDEVVRVATAWRGTFSLTPDSDGSALAPSGYEHFFLPARTGPNPHFAGDMQAPARALMAAGRGLLLYLGGGGFVKSERGLLRR